MNDNHPVPGAHYSQQQCDFIVWAPRADKVALALSDTPPVEMHPEADGYWRKRMDARPGDTYWFIVDGKRLADPASRSQPEGVHGPSSVCERNFEWSDSTFIPARPGDMIQYELHVGTFTQAGTFGAIAEKFGYLQSLGINAIELMPIAQFPGERNWGYDGVFPFAVQNTYGGLLEFKSFVNQAHQAGFTIILDVVYNHTGPEGSVLKDFGPYFTDLYHTGWGDAINFDGAYSDGVREFFLENARFWLEDCHVDALRLDAVHAIYDNSATHIVEALRGVADQVSARTGKAKILIAELDLNHPRYLDAPERGGFGIAAQWADEFHHALHAVTTGERDGYYEDFGAVADLRKAIRDSWVFTGQFSDHRKRHFGAPSDKFSHDRFVIFSQNHDQTGNRLKGDRISSLVSTEKQKFCAGVMLLAPQIPLLFMGEEYGETNPFCYFADHQDDQLIKAVREGRKKEFAHFNWAEDIPDPFDRNIFNGCKLSWSVNDEERTSLLACYRWLIQFRKTRDALKEHDRKSVTLREDSGDELIIMERAAENDWILVVMNPTAQAQQFSLESGLKRIFEINPHHEALTAGPWGIIIFEK